MNKREFKFFSMRMPVKLHIRVKRAAKSERRSASNWAMGVLEQAVKKSERRKEGKE